MLLACSGSSGGTTAGNSLGAAGTSGIGGAGGSPLVCSETPSVGGGPDTALPTATPGCNTLALPVAVFPELGTGTLPYLKGGTILEGTYASSRVVVYPQSGYDVTLKQKAIGYRFRFHDGLLDEAIVIDTSNAHGTAVYQTQCGMMSIRGFCGSMETDAFAYEATQDGFRYQIHDTGYDTIVVLDREVGAAGAGGGAGAGGSAGSGGAG